MSPQTDGNVIGAYSVYRVGTTCYEIRNSEGVIIAWTSDEAIALLLAELLRAADEEGASQTNSGVLPEEDGIWPRKERLR